MRLIALLLLFASSVTDYSGTWVLNIEKSQLGTPTPKSNVMKVEKTGPNTFLASFDLVLADGKEEHLYYTETYDGQAHAIWDDGKDHPGTPKGATETYTQVNPLTRHVVGKNNGKVHMEMDSKIAPDGKTMTSRQTIFAPDGKTKEVQIFVWERQ
jgi:hypothetical protein